MFSQGHWPTEAIWLREELVDEEKPFKIPKREIWQAFKRVKANQGAAGVDGQLIAAFEANLSGNLYKLGVAKQQRVPRRPGLRVSFHEAGGLEDEGR